MTPWELQKEFYLAVSRFYTLASSFRIWKVFGANFGLRRMGLAFLIKLGVPAMHLMSLLQKTRMRISCGITAARRAR
jgi:hypothetical protein